MIIKIVAVLTAIAVMFALVGNTHITIKPFKITIDHPLKAVGLLLFWIGITIYSEACARQGHNEGHLQGYTEGIKDMRKSIQDDYFLFEKPKEDKN